MPGRRDSLRNKPETLPLKRHVHAAPAERSRDTTMKHVLVILTAAALLASCRREDVVYYPDQTSAGRTQHTEWAGFYLLNEGNMGSNKSTLDYYDFGTATYTRNIYANANPTVVQELGDVGNDLRIYGDRLYAVINCSNLLEVMDARTARHIGSVEVPNCRYICFEGGYAYLTSYAGPVEVGKEHAQIGYVAKIDTAALQVVDTCLVGYQPDGICAAGGKLYVANSGGYMVPDYEDELSVIDRASFRETGRIKVAINLHRVLADSHGGIWVSSRGDYYGTPSRLFRVSSATGTVTDTINTATSEMCLTGDSIYLCGTEYNYQTGKTTVNYGIVNVVTRSLVSDSFITDGTESEITVPYGLAVNSANGDIYVTDARDYVSPGKLVCYDRAGVRQWTVRTGDIPAHFAFLPQPASTP